MTTYLTNSGNILVVNSSNAFFQTQKGQFLRYVKDSGELEFLTSKLSVVYSTGFDIVKNPPKWQFLWETTHKDDSNYYWARSNNGGCYYEITTSYFFCRVINGKKEFCRLDKTQNSSEFQTTSDGNYQNSGVTTAQFFDVENAPNDATWFDYWSGHQGELDYEDCPLEAFAEPCSLMDCLKATNSGYTSEYDDNGCHCLESEYWEDETTFQQRLVRYKKIKNYEEDKKV